MSIEAMKQMVKALESATVDCSNFHHAKKDQNHHLGECPLVIRWHHAIEAGRQAIKELESQYPHGMYGAEDLDKAWKSGYDNCKDQYVYLDEQEPVAWACRVVGGRKWLSIHASKGASDKWLEYRIKEQAQGEQYEQVKLHAHPLQPAKPIPCANHCEATAFEIVIKNLQGEIESLKASQRTEQEPVAMQMGVIVGNLVREGINKHRARELAEHFIRHTHPPQRTWIKLTDEEIASVGYNNHPLDGIKRYARAIEAKLKEKNT